MDRDAKAACGDIGAAQLDIGGGARRGARANRPLLIGLQADRQIDGRTLRSRLIGSNNA
ncbi:MAG TPA: hypothetical protein VNZ06_07480 [Steroidobacteraceae bacterium]|nr:hypothetical protein [Steroidobacteraceae bacterium]